MSDAEILNELRELKAKVNLLIEREIPNRSYNLAQFVQAVGISKYKLKNLYKSCNLPIPAPYRINGHDPTYTMEHVELVRKILNGYR